jgi:chemotaxis protein histidine kinase CheA/CheY-like chemotaxis protein
VAVDQEARRQKRLALFRQVASERIAKLNLLWIDVERSDGDPAPFLREAHTLKGEASLTGFALASKSVHAIEDYVKVVRDRGRQPEQGDGDLILSGLDLIARLAQGSPDAPSSDADEFLAKVAAQLGGRAPEPTPPPVAKVASPGPTGEPSGTTPVPEDARGKNTPPPVVLKREASIRVTAEKIDHLRGMVSDILLSSVRWRQLTRATRRVREAVQNIAQRRMSGVGEDQFEAWTSILGDLSAIESRLRDETHDLERFAGDLDATTRELRMIPLATLLDHFPLPLRQLARSLGRQIRFEIAGEQVEVDKALLEMLEEPLLHLLRNAVDHGVEPPEERIRAGKPAQATVRIVAGLVGQRLHLEVSDDGRGIDVEAIRRRARVAGLLDEPTAEMATREQLLRTIFAAGFSTREQVSEVSGRGIGLNIVLDVVENVGGRVEVKSELSRGTTFDIEVPLTVAITRVVLFRVGVGMYALPAASVRTLVETQSLPRVEGPDGPSVRYAGIPVPLLDLGQVLDEPETVGSDARIVVAQSGADLVALTGTRGHLEREVILKPMGRFFEKLPLVAAAVNLEEGALALVLKAAELVLLSRSSVRKRLTTAQSEARRGEGRIALVADDSPVVRDIIAQALRSYGLHVLVAGDGEEALTLFGAHSRVDIVVTDIDMPRLDGIGLVRALRSRESSKNVPVVAISMRGSEPEKRAAMEAGMSAYIDKSDFNQALLWQTIRPFVTPS